VKAEQAPERRYRASRCLFDSKDAGIINARDAHVAVNGDLVLAGYDSDPELERFIGQSDWEAEMRVAERDVELVREALRAESAPASGKRVQPDEELFDLIAAVFPGLTVMTKFQAWLDRRKIPYSYQQR
jgi:hypothetical protein